MDDPTLDELENLLSQPPETKPRKSKTDLLENRNILNWFKLPTTSSRDCEVPDHDVSRPRNKGMTTIINDVAVCRICYLNELDRDRNTD